MSFVELIAVLGNLGGFIGAVAVVLTLIYLTIQVRHSTRSMEENTRQMKVLALNQHDELVGLWRGANPDGP